MLGLRVTDKVTGFKGVCTSVCFDLYGCVQATINPGLDKDGKPMEGRWYDIARLGIDALEPVMQPPNFEIGPVAEGKHGCEEKPALD